MYLKVPGQHSRFQAEMPLANTPMPNAMAGCFIKDLIRKHSHWEGELLINCLDVHGEAVPLCNTEKPDGEHHHGAGTLLGVNPDQGGDQWRGGEGQSVLLAAHPEEQTHCWILSRLQGCVQASQPGPEQCQHLLISEGISTQRLVLLCSKAPREPLHPAWDSDPSSAPCLLTQTTPQPRQHWATTWIPWLSHQLPEQTASSAH